MERSDFALFFAALNGGLAVQMAGAGLLDSLLENGRWPIRSAWPWW